MYKDIPPPPLRIVEVIVREDNGADHRHTFETRAQQESTIILEALIWFERIASTTRADNSQVIIVSNKLKDAQP